MSYLNALFTNKLNSRLNKIEYNENECLQSVIMAPKSKASLVKLSTTFLARNPHFPFDGHGST